MFTGDGQALFSGHPLLFFDAHDTADRQIQAVGSSCNKAGKPALPSSMRPCNTLCFPNHAVPAPCLIRHGSCRHVNSHDNRCSWVKPERVPFWLCNVIVPVMPVCVDTGVETEWVNHGRAVDMLASQAFAFSFEPSDDNCFSIVI